MTFKLTNKTTTLLLSSALLGGVIISSSPALTTEVQAYNLEDAPISYQTFKTDENAVKKAVKNASPAVRQQINADFFKRMEQNPVNAYGYAISPYFSQIMQSMASHAISELGHNGQVTSAFKQDYNAMIAVYDQFKNRLDPLFQNVVNEYIDDANHQISSNKVKSETINDIYGYFDQYFGKNIRPTKITGVPKVKSSITKLAARKTASKKYVKVTGSAKLSKSANYAHIKTYKGYRYAKLSSKHNFNKTIYAPKAKTVKVTVGHYSNGHYTAVTATKTVHIK